MAGVLKARVGGAWVPISMGGPDEVAVGPDDPGSGIELWYDTDEVAAKAYGLLPAGGATDQVPAKTSGADFATAWVNQARGIVAYAEVTANQTGIPGGSNTDITGLSLTFTALAGRSYRIVSCMAIVPTAAASLLVGTMEGGNYHGTAGYSNAAAGVGVTLRSEAIRRGTLTPGAHTVKSIAWISVTGGQMTASSGAPSFIMVEDIGPST